MGPFILCPFILPQGVELDPVSWSLADYKRDLT